MSKDDFGGKARTEVVFGREGYPRNGVQDRALTGRLIATYDQLRKIHVLTDPIGTQLVNIVQKSQLFVGAQNFDHADTG